MKLRSGPSAAARLEAVRAQTDAARAQESGAHTMLGYTHLVAPFAGVVTARMADPGTLASPGVPLLQVDQAGALQLQATVDESAIGAVHKGMKVQVAIDGGDSANLAGTVAEIDPGRRSGQPQLSGQDRSAFFEPIARRHVWNGGVCQRHPPGDCHSALGCRLRGSLACAYVLDAQGIAQLRYLTLGATQGNLVEVLSGISAGEKLVDDPADRDLAGKRIEVQP